MSADSSLVASGLRARIGGVELLRGVSLEAGSGRITAVVGRNGAGKSTLLATLARIMGTGSVRLGDTDLDSLSRRSRAATVAMVHQSLQSDADLTVRDAVSLGRLPHVGNWAWSDDDDRAVMLALHHAGIMQFEHRELTTLSGGERQRVGIAMALAQEPRLLLVDEPSNHLDVGSALAMMAVLRDVARTGATVIVALHDLSLALEASDDVIVMEGGAVRAAGGTSRVLTEELISDIYDVEARILVDPELGTRALHFSLPAAGRGSKLRRPRRDQTAAVAP